MSIQVSTHLIRAMGFLPMAPGEEIRAEFFSLHVYETRGIDLDAGVVRRAGGDLDGVPYELAAGASVNQIVRELTGDDLVDDEAKWVEKHRCHPPYVVIRIGPTALHSCVNKHAQRAGNRVITFDAFGPAKAELCDLESAALPRLVTGLAAALDSDNLRVRLIPVERYVIGRTPEQHPLNDIRISGSATAFASTSIPAAALDAALSRATALAAGAGPKAAHVFRHALAETDPYKRFLFAFLAIEIQTNLDFDARYDPALGAGLLAGRHAIKAPDLFLPGPKKQLEHSIARRFAWCANCVWPAVGEPDIYQFKRLTDTRNSLAHGDMTDPHGWLAEAAEKLAVRLHRLRA